LAKETPFNNGLEFSSTELKDSIAGGLTIPQLIPFSHMYTLSLLSAIFY